MKNTDINMAKLLRLHTNGGDTLKGWCETRLYNRDIEEIRDPNAAFSAKEMTSIPSSFAHLHIVKCAFQYVIDSRRLKGETKWHLLVSHSLDVGEILFNYHRYKDKFEIVEWKREDALLKLKQSSYKHHPALAEVIEQFMRLEANFGLKDLESIFLLKYIGPGKKSDLDIVEGISPMTLFFASPDDLSYISEHVDLGTHKAFELKGTPLNERDYYYQSYILYLKVIHTEFYRLFPELGSYINFLQYYIESNEQEMLLELSNNQEYEPLVLDKGTTIKIWGEPLPIRKSREM